MEDELDGVAVSCDDDESGLSAVQGLGGLVGANLQDVACGCLLDELEDLFGQLVIGLGEDFVVLRYVLVLCCEGVKGGRERNLPFRSSLN